MDVATAIERSGDSTRAALIAATARLDVDRALQDGVIVRAGHGRYTVPGVGAAARIAHGANGVLSLTSAALHHGWEVKAAPDKPHVLFPATATSRRSGGRVVVHVVTSPWTTSPTAQPAGS